MVARRSLVLGLWALVTLGGLWASVDLPQRLTTTLAVPGSSSAAANQVLARDFHQSVEGTFTVVVRAPHASASRVTKIEASLRVAARSLPGGRISQERSLFGLVLASVSTPDSLQRAASLTPVLRRALSAEGLGAALVTGPPALEHDLAPVLAGDLRQGELVAVVLAALLLMLLLGPTWAALVPLGVAAATVGAALVLIDLVARHTTMVLYIPNVVELIGLGLAIDYGLLMVHRHRREMAIAPDGALERTMASAGRTVATSGVVVGVGLAVLLALPVPFLRSLGVAALAVPVAAVLSALTLQPALLSLLGPRRPSPRRFSGLLTSRDPLHGRWARLGRAVVTRPRLFAAGALLLLLVAGAGSLGLALTPASQTGIPPSLPSARALSLVDRTVGPGVASPLILVIDTGRPGGVFARSQVAARLRLGTKILQDPEAFIVAIGPGADYRDPSGRYALIDVIPRHGFGDPATRAFVGRLESRLIPAAHLPSTDRVDLGGAPGQGADFLNAVYGAFPWIVAAALLVALAILARAFASPLLALMAVLLDLLSVGAAYGVTVWVFRDGVASALLHTYRQPQIEGWVPVFVFAVLFGLSSDYEVFLVSRMAEAHRSGSSAREAIVEGMAHTGGVVSAAAAVLVVALAGLVAGRVAGLQELGVALAAGVALDATVVRGVLLPSLMSLLGEGAWWRPRARRAVAH